MLPTAYPFSLASLARLWQTFMETGACTPLTPSLPDPAVVQSWRRCALRLSPHAAPRLTRLKTQALTAVLKAQEDLATLAMPFLEDMYQFIEGSDCALLLADGSACLLALAGNPQSVSRLEQRGWDTGTYWSEGQLGTNALGVCLFTAMPTQVVGAEHYFSALHELVTTAAPIHAVNGRIVGIVGVVGPAEAATSQTLSLVMAVARAIGNQLQTEWLLQETNRHLSEVTTLLTAVHEGVIAWNADGIITHLNSQAGEILGLAPSSVTGLPVTAVLSLPPVISEAMSAANSLNDIETTIQIDEKTIPLLANLRLIGNGQNPPVGFMLMIRPMAQVRRLVQKQMGAQASLKLDYFSDQSPGMRRVIRQAVVAARARAPVLLRGEGGVGKNLMAQAIHNAGPRANASFLAISCRAIPHELMIGEFMGIEEDSAGNGRPSKFELVDGGTLLLDQVESLSLEMQAALLQVIERRQLLRLNGWQPRPVDVRIIATTSADLEARVADGRFLSQLYYRLGVFSLTLPPLRERVEDIPLLVARFLARKSGVEFGPAGVDEAAMKLLQAYPWPGNVRELESVLELTLDSSQGTVMPPDLPEIILNGRAITNASPLPKPVLTVAEMEREAILRAGWSCQGQVTRMAEQLGIGRATLWRKMKRYNISSQQFKGDPS